MHVTDIVEEYLLAWVLLAVAAGVALPRLAVLTTVATPLLAVMIGSISLTLSVHQFRQVDRPALALVVVGHVAMPVLAFAIATAIGLSAPLVVGFVLLGAVTPELVTPVMTALAGGDTALSTSALVVIGVGSVGFVPLVVAALGGGDTMGTAPVTGAVPPGSVSPMPIVEQLVVAVAVPMVAAVWARTRWPTAVGRYDAYYPSVSATMVVLVVAGVTAASGDVLRSNPDVLAGVAVAAVVLNLVGYGLGLLLSRGRRPPIRIATVLSVGMRDFAVAAALVVAAGLPPVASLPAVVFGVVEMTTSAGLVAWLSER